MEAIAWNVPLFAATSESLWLSVNAGVWSALVLTRIVTGLTCGFKWRRSLPLRLIRLKSYVSIGMVLMSTRLDKLG